jgi:glycerol-3-phosphate O-acyltransferase / dihydroxyacetone phosphate acyltransferase
MHQQIGSGTLDAPSWRLHRIAKLAAKIYAPLGTQMSLGDYIRVVRTFLEGFKLAESSRSGEGLSGSDLEADSTVNDENAGAITTRVLKLEEDLKVT